MDISVIIPTYNRANLIKQSIISVLKQTLSPVEIIVVDDFSTDNTAEIIKSIEDSRVKYIKNYRKKGANGARNSGILQAKAPYIAFQDSDDIWMPTKLEKQSKVMIENPQYDMCFCSIMTDSKIEKTIIPEKKVEMKKIQQELLNRNFISTQTIFVKTRVAQEILFDEDLKRLQDWDFNIRISEKYDIFHLDEPLVDVEVQNDSITKTINFLDSYEVFFMKHPTVVNSSIRNKYIYHRIEFRNRITEKKYMKSIPSSMKLILYRIFLILTEIF